MDNTTNTSGKNPHHNVYDEKHFATRAYFYYKDYQDGKSAEAACYEYKGTILKATTKEVYFDNEGCYFFL